MQLLVLGQAVAVTIDMDVIDRDRCKPLQTQVNHHILAIISRDCVAALF